MSILHLNFSSQKMLQASLTDWRKALWVLTQMLGRFREYENEPWHGRSLRNMPIDNYCVFYIPDAKNAVVTIIMYGGTRYRHTIKQIHEA